LRHEYARVGDSVPLTIAIKNLSLVPFDGGKLTLRESSYFRPAVLEVPALPAGESQVVHLLAEAQPNVSYRDLPLTFEIDVGHHSFQIPVTIGMRLELRGSSGSDLTIASTFVS